MMFIGGKMKRSETAIQFAHSERAVRRIEPDTPVSVLKKLRKI